MQGQTQPFLEQCKDQTQPFLEQRKAKLNHF